MRLARARACAWEQRNALLGILALVALFATFVVDQIARPCLSCDGSTNQTLSSECNAATACTLLGLQLFTGWLANNLALGSVLFALLYAACTVLIVPTSVLTLGGGAAYTLTLGLGPGLLLASLVVLLGASLGALIAFLLARHLLHGFVQRLVKRWRLGVAINAALRRAGLRMMLLLRLSTIVPFNVFNYAIAGSDVSLRHYVLALPAMLPATATYAFIGATLADAAVASGQLSTARALQTALLAVGALATVLALFLLSWMAKRELERNVHRAADDVAADCPPPSSAPPSPSPSPPPPSPPAPSPIPSCAISVLSA